MKFIKYVLFYLKAVFTILPFKPKKCYVLDRTKCRIWNCKYHYKNNRYDDCQKVD